VLAILEARLGPDGFDFEDPAGDEDGARELFMDWLDAQPGEGARFYEMSGMMTGLLAAPVSIAPLSIIEAMWGPKGPTWADREEAQAFLDLFMGYWNYIAGRVLDTIAQDAPAEEHPVDIRPEELPEGNGLAVAAASVDWAQGFLRTTARWPEAWGDALQRPDLAPHWEVIRWWADLAKPGNLARVQAAAEGAEQRTLAKAVSALVRALRGGKGLSDQHETR
jgi:yecA family protein